MGYARHGRRIVAIVVLLVPALASASLGAREVPPAGRIVFVSDLSPAAAAPGRRMRESRIHAFPVDGVAHLDLTGAATLGSDSGISLSPDRRTIAFLRTRRGTDVAELWIAGADGTNARRLLAPTPAESFIYSDSEPYFQAPAWSPQGDTIAIDVVSTASCLPGYTKCATWYTTLVGLDGRRRDAGGVNALWSPSGDQLLVRAGLFSLEDPNEWILGTTRSDGTNGWDTKSTWKRPEACWAGGSWSPDGTRLVLTEAGCEGSARRLHLVGAQDGDHLAVVRGCCASWSPDGRQLWYVAFREGGNELTILTRDGKPLRRVGRNLDLVGWSPQGADVAVVRHRPRRDELVFMRAGGTQPRLVAWTRRQGLEAVGWSRDGRRFAFLGGERNRAQLVVARGDGTHARVLVESAGRVLTNGSWSPDNRHLAFWDTREGTASRLTVVDTTTWRSRAVYRALDGAYAFAAGWVAEGRRLVVQETVGGLYPAELWSLRPDGSGLRRLTRNKQGELGPAWSPDGSRVAFWRDDPQAGKKPEDLSVYVIHSNGTGLQRVVGGTKGRYASDPTWSRDGRSLAFVLWPDTNHTDVWVLGLDGKRLRRLTRTGHAYAPEWSQDGRLIAFSDDGTPRAVAPDGMGVHPLFGGEAVGYCSGFSWSPDGRALAAACGIPGGLIVSHSDGSDLRVVDGSADGAPSFSPDGSRLVYASDDGLRIVDANGGPPTTIDLRGASASQPDWSSR